MSQAKRISDALYCLPSNESEKERLSLQHQIVKTVFGGRLICAPISFGDGDTILDTGTGAASWILDVAATVPPSVSLQGIDISGAMFPASVPSNLQLAEHSILALPEDWSDKFTLVHQRFLMAAFSYPQWQRALSEIYRVTKPGGWVQICEPKEQVGGRVNMGPVEARFAAMFRGFLRSRGLVLDLDVHLPRLLEEAGFVDTREEHAPVPVGKWAGQLGIDSRDDLIAIFQTMKGVILQEGGLEHVKSEAEYEECVQALGKEWDEIPGHEFKVYMLVAQKPRT
ncbi:hypothetical protein PLICRDRAFT_145206 [Plicaturopsis crispa FD-325 SS-3]|nr:hypothetical protein PLICRDRAFT_145206 [Plicaturopsis crispa FD-325 SS-3]